MDKRYKICRSIIISLFVIFLTLYFSQLTGYYEYQNYEKMVLTQDQIAQFENDVKEGKKIDVEDYIKNKDRNYQNGISKLGLNISNFLSVNIKKGVFKTFDFIGKFVQEEN